MRKAPTVIAILALLALSFQNLARPASGDVAAENFWVSKASMGSARGYLGVAAVNGKIYAIGGDQGHLWGNVGNALEKTHEVTNTNEEYDPASDKWVWKSQMPTARARFGIAVHQNKIYCIGGYDDKFAEVGANEVYDPATDTWEVKASLPTPLYTPAANVVDGKIYVMGGYESSMVEVYDPETDTWATKNAPPLKVRGSTSAVVDSKIFVLGEELIDPVLYRVGYRVQVYDPANDSWSIRASAPTIPFSCAVATSGLNALKRIYFFDETSNDVYDPSNDRWTVGASAPTHRPLADAVVIDDLIYVIGGRTGEWGYIVDMQPSTANEQYTPFGYGAVPPDVNIISPENTNYTSNNVTLAFTVNKQVEWVGYSLDGQENVTINGNTTLSELSNGLHNIKVYARDEFENFGVSETITFSVEEPFPTTLVIAIITSLVIVGVGLIVYLKKYKW